MELCELIPKYYEQQQQSMSTTSSFSAIHSSSSSKNKKKNASSSSPLLMLPSQVERACLNSSKDAALTIFSMIIFLLKADVFDAFGAVDGHPDAATTLSISQSSLNIINLRDKLIDVLGTWMEEAPQSGNSDVSVSSSSEANRNGGINKLGVLLQREAFNMVSDLRSLFPVRNSAYEYLNDLAYRPSQEILNSMRRVFDQEGRALERALAVQSNGGSDGDREEDNAADHHQQQQRGNNEVDGSAAAAAGAVMVDYLLFPLGRSLLFDMSNLNRRQAAAIINYIMEPSEVVQDAVKALMKQLKDADVVKYLEVQLVALKNNYLDHVVRIVKEQEYAEANDENYDPFHYDSLRLEGVQRVENLAKKLAPTMGVGKLKGIPLAALYNFFQGRHRFRTF